MAQQQGGQQQQQQHGFQPAVLHAQQLATMPISTQPSGLSPGAAGGAPPGLEYLAQVDQLLVQQKVELLEAFVGFETANKYTVTNTLGQQVFYVVEDTGCCTRMCCGPARPFDIRIMDAQQREVIHLSRPLRCQLCCCPCCLQELEVTAGDGQVIGRVRQDWSLLRPKYSVQRADGSTVLKIAGPICTCSLCGDVEFFVMSADGTQEVGKITKQWTGLVKEMFTDADQFGISFPMDLETNVKATLLGGLFLIDFMYFERSADT